MLTLKAFENLVWAEISAQMVSGEVSGESELVETLQGENLPNHVLLKLCTPEIIYSRNIGY